MLHLEREPRVSDIGLASSPTDRDPAAGEAPPNVGKNLRPAANNVGLGKKPQFRTDPTRGGGTGPPWTCPEDRAPRRTLPELELGAGPSDTAREAGGQAPGQFRSLPTCEFYEFCEFSPLEAESGCASHESNASGKNSQNSQNSHPGASIDRARIAARPRWTGIGTRYG